jgi:hypothetical protein
VLTVSYPKKSLDQRSKQKLRKTRNDAQQTANLRKGYGAIPQAAQEVQASKLVEQAENDIRSKATY